MTHLCILKVLPEVFDLYDYHQTLVDVGQFSRLNWGGFHLHIFVNLLECVANISPVIWSCREVVHYLSRPSERGFHEPLMCFIHVTMKYIRSLYSLAKMQFTSLHMISRYHKKNWQKSLRAGKEMWSTISLVHYRLESVYFEAATSKAGGGIRSTLFCRYTTPPQHNLFSFHTVFHTAMKWTSCVNNEA